ncbi:MAG: hypothetical protein ACI8YI_001246 [Paracoccaceae bacterium]
MTSISRIAAAFLMLALPASAQEPLSVIDWLSQSVREKPSVVDQVPLVVEGAGTQEIEVTSLDAIRKDSVGILPSTVTGLPRNFWGSSSSETIASLVAKQATDSLPELLSLLYTILLAEVDAPQTSSGGSVLLLARVDKLLDLGALDQAQALIERAGPDEAELFRRWFDVSLLTGHEDHACTAMRAAPGFAPTLQARVFCLARNGDWNAAALTLATGETLAFISREDADLMTRFLDPGMFEDQPDLPLPSRLTPLIFTMREAIAQPRPTGALPLAFVNADLKPSSPWRKQMEAAERLVRSHALSANHLIDLYTENQAAASGGIWDRVEAIQRFDVALLSGDLTAISGQLPAAYQAMKEIAIEVPFALHYGDRLSDLGFKNQALHDGFELALLSNGYEGAARDFQATDTKDLFLKGLAIGNVTGLAPPGTLGIAIADAFLAPMPNGQLKSLLEEKKLGEAILRAMLLLKDEAFADPGDIRAALSAFRAVGLEQEARRIALQLLLLERRG